MTNFFSNGRWRGRAELLLNRVGHGVDDDHRVAVVARHIESRLVRVQDHAVRLAVGLNALGYAEERMTLVDV